MRLKCLLFAVTLVFLAAPVSAQQMRLTIYDDGLSCPGDCDAHVVINQADNGTRFAFRPGSVRTAPQKCQVNEDCTICFGASDNSCMTARYRGGGPKAGTFDFTPAFYEENCPRNDIPTALRQQCTSLDRAVTQRGYHARTNCFAAPDHEKCSAAIAAAGAAREADLPKFARCREFGEQAFNAQQTNPREKRSNNCAYSQLQLGGSGRWRLLLPAACREGSFVGRDGLDCCNSNTRFAASVHPECTAFFPR